MRMSGIYNRGVEAGSATFYVPGGCLQGDVYTGVGCSPELLPNGWNYVD